MWQSRLFLLLSMLHSQVYISDALKLKDLKHYELVDVHHVGVDGNGRYKRDLSTKQSDGSYLDSTKYEIQGLGRNFHLHLHQNDITIPKAINIMSQNADGSYQSKKDVPRCHYQGSLVDKRNSFATVSACDDELRGVIIDEDGEEFVIEPYHDEASDSSSAKHVLYNRKDDVNNPDLHCGVKDSKQDDTKLLLKKLVEQVLDENSKTTSKKSSRQTMYIELLAIVDNAEYGYYLGQAKGDATEALRLTTNRAMTILNVVDSYYKRDLNTRVVLSHLLIWDVKNIVPVSSSAGTTLTALQTYSQDVLQNKMKLIFDTAQMILYTSWGSLSGLGGIGNMCSTKSAAVNRDIGSHWKTASTLAHEMAHNIGLQHTTCRCISWGCIMSAYSVGRGEFSQCSKDLYEEIAQSPSLSCLSNYPRTFYMDPVCGNGLKEKGEECDCGSESECKTDCCDWSTCKLKAHAKCADGACCENCQFKQQGVLCRDRVHNDCDLEEYCNGKENRCPNNLYIHNGAVCDNGASYCYQGSCSTIDTECRVFWGPNAMQASGWCFDENLRGKDHWASCGKDKNDNYIKCAPGNQKCGKLQCKAKPGTKLPTFPIIGSGRSRRVVSSGPDRCVQGNTNTGADMEDPSIAKSGVKCGNNKICVDHKCVDLSKVEKKKCKKPCLNGGVCNSNGNCHCKKGFACPFCEFSGMGGSTDSGAICKDAPTDPPKKGNCISNPMNLPGVTTLENKRNSISWENYQQFIKSLHADCLSKAKTGGYQYIFIEWWGICRAVKTLDLSTLSRVDISTDKLAKCKSGTFQPCKDDGKEICTGIADVGYLYPVDG